jgi:hypothetical protein
MKRIRNSSPSTTRHAWSHAFAAAVALGAVAGCGDDDGGSGAPDGGMTLLDGSVLDGGDGGRPDVDCLAMLTVTFGSETEETAKVLDFCQARNITADFEFDPDTPPEVRNARLQLYAATAADVDCYIDISLPSACGPGYYPLDGDGNSVRLVTLDCPGIPNEFEGDYVADFGYVRVDEFSAGTASGDFSGMALTTRFAGFVSALKATSRDPLRGVIINGAFIARETIVGRDAEGVMCETSSGDADGDGAVDWFKFDGPDCDDNDPTIAPGLPCSSGVGACAGTGMYGSTCNEDGTQLCETMASAPAAETCNSVDDDCDGTTDEGAGCFAEGARCSDSADCVDAGVCAASGASARCVRRCDAITEPFCSDGSPCNVLTSTCDGVGPRMIGSFGCDLTVSGEGCVSQAACVSESSSINGCLPVCVLGTTCSNGTTCSPLTDFPDAALRYPGLGFCVRSCTGRSCGPDGWEGSCGTCRSGTTCNDAGMCVTSCTPSCSGRTCGSDGCGGSCGTCASGTTCNAAGMCTSSCTPSCSGRMCGSDGCGGSCGTCASGTTCNASGMCTSSCTPSCSGRMCGSDGCGGSCGTCASGTTCNASGMCVSTMTPPIGSACTTDSECGAGRICLPEFDGWLGGYCSLDCTSAVCPSGSTCISGATSIDICLVNCPPACRSGYTCTAAGAANVCF